MKRNFTESGGGNSYVLFWNTKVYILGSIADDHCLFCLILEPNLS